VHSGRQRPERASILACCGGNVDIHFQCHVHPRTDVLCRGATLVVVSQRIKDEEYLDSTPHADCRRAIRRNRDRRRVQPPIVVAIGAGASVEEERDERRRAEYGIAPVPDPSVTYQPDVIVVGGGADAIRAQSSNGFIWTIDGHAPHAADLAPGKIFFLTNRAVGRVLDIRNDHGRVRNTTMSATGDYTFSGSFKVGYSGGTWGVFDRRPGCRSAIAGWS
jgi:hypothetical protein